MVWLPDLNALNEVLSAADVKTDCGSPKRAADGSFIVTLYGPSAEAQKIAALSYRTELDDHFGELLEQAHEQVSKTDRFQGGKIKPEGLGIKR
ncbi:MAG TPA: hypothetical protein VH458_02105 [Vicinamibacterales bacterium]|jgi:hypothetical protein